MSPMLKCGGDNGFEYRLCEVVAPNVQERVLLVTFSTSLARLAKPELKVACRTVDQGAPQERTQS
jgi:hypothetical protein